MTLSDIFQFGKMLMPLSLILFPSLSPLGLLFCPLKQSGEREGKERERKEKKSIENQLRVKVNPFTSGVSISQRALDRGTEHKFKEGFLSDFLKAILIEIVCEIC